MKYQPGILVILILFILPGCSDHDFVSKKDNPPVSKLFPPNFQLKWPTAGQAAIGTVEDGVLARSSDDEDLNPTASIAKVITALAVMERQPFRLGEKGQSYTIHEDDVLRSKAYRTDGGSVLPVFAGKKITQYEALQRMLIFSDNNAADILVERTFGSIESYALYAQNMLRRMGLTRTIVADASGFDAATVSTPSELIAIGILALKNEVIATIVSQRQSRISGIGLVKNRNQLLGVQGVVGIKTGTTKKAGSCLLFAARYAKNKRDSGTIVGVIMGDTNHRMLYADSENLLASAKQGLGAAGPRLDEKRPLIKKRLDRPGKKIVRIL